MMLGGSLRRTDVCNMKDMKDMKYSPIHGANYDEYGDYDPTES